MARTPGELATELARPGFTPGQRDAGALAELVAGDDDAAAARAAPALASLGDAGRRAACDRFAAVADAGAKARLVGALGLLARAGDREARALLVERMHDAEVRVRRAAATALGKLDGGDDVRAALLARWDASDVPADERRVLVEALGKLGGDDVVARLRALAPADDAELARRRDRALLMADRGAQRAASSEIATDVAPPAPVSVRLGCKAGLAALLVEELAALGVKSRALVDREVEIELATPLSSLFASHLWATIAVRVPFVAGGDLADALTRAITAPPVRGLLRAWTRGPIRWRLGFASGHKRAVVWRVARDVTTAAPELVNDPTATTWDILVADDHLELVPRKLVDPRFAWRVAEVPAASHPSVAAALVWVAGVRDDDRVWDPFCGSGLELVERARRGSYRRLIGSDVDETALAAARANAAGLAIELIRGDARSLAPGPVDLVITNPPLGSRVQLDAVALLADALPNLVAQLAPRGRLVWITPATRKTSPICEKLGLVRARHLPVDLGGVRGHLERWDRG